MRRLSPAGTPINGTDIINWIRTISDTKTTSSHLVEVLKQYFDVPYCYLLSTGRAAMVILLQCLAESNKHKKTVIIPSYTCYSVPASIIKAGLNVQVCDIEASTLDYNYEKLVRVDYTNVLAIISNNLYGIPGDLDRLERFAQKRNIFLVDDAAQCMGAKSTSGRLAGSFGDAGLFSLDKGKVITSMNGGILITKSKTLARQIETISGSLQSPSPAHIVLETAKMLLYSILLRPHFYWIPSSLPLLRLGKTVYSTEYPLLQYNNFLAGIVVSLFQRFEHINEQRKKNGEYYRKKIHHSNSIQHIEVDSEKKPIYIRYPLLIKDNEIRRQVMSKLDKKGLGASSSYPRSVADIPEISGNREPLCYNCRAGRSVADQIITLPTHPLVTASDRNKIISLINSYNR